MQPSRPPGERRAAVLAALVTLERRLAFTGRWGGRAALAVLVFTGEMLRFAEAAGALPFQSGVWAIHVMAGLAVALAAGGRGATRVARALAWPEGWLWSLPGRRRAGWRPRPTLAGLVTAGYWSALALLLLSGLQSYLFRRHGVMLLPGLSPTGWQLVHHLLPPYFYALALVRFTLLFRPFWRRLRSYLYSP